MYSKTAFTFGGNDTLMVDRTSAFSLFFRKGYIWILAFSLTGGMVLGSRLQANVDPSLISLMRASGIQSVSIVSRLSVLLLPFLFSALFCSTRSAWMIFPVSFFKGFCFGFCQASIFSSFAGAGWLIYFFLMFSDILTFPVLVFFWIRCLGKTGHMTSRLLFCMLAVLIIAAVDHRFITPYYISLFT